LGEGKMCKCANVQMGKWAIQQYKNLNAVKALSIAEQIINNQ